MLFSEGIDSAKTARSGQMLIIGDEALRSGQVPGSTQAKDRPTSTAKVPVPSA